MNFLPWLGPLSSSVQNLWNTIQNWNIMQCLKKSWNNLVSNFREQCKCPERTPIYKGEGCLLDFLKRASRGTKILYCGHSMEYFLTLGGRYYNFVVSVNRLFKIILNSILTDSTFSSISLNGTVSAPTVDLLRIKTHTKNYQTLFFNP